MSHQRDPDGAVRAAHVWWWPAHFQLQPHGGGFHGVERTIEVGDRTAVRGLCTTVLHV